MALPRPSGPRLRRAAAIALLLAPAACNVPQIMIGLLYRIATPAVGDCPALVWTFAVDVQRHIAGDLARVGQQAFAGLDGTLAADESFRISIVPAPGAPLRAPSSNRSHSAARDVIQSGTSRGGCAFGELRINRNTQSPAGARRTIGHVVTCLPHVTRRGARITCWCPEDRAGGRDQAGRNRAALVTAHIPPGTGVEFC